MSVSALRSQVRKIRVRLPSYCEECSPFVRLRIIEEVVDSHEDVERLNEEAKARPPAPKPTRCPKCSGPWPAVRKIVETVIVDGKVCMENVIIPGVDFSQLRAEAQAAGETIWATLPDWDPLGRNAEEACPYCYPDAGSA